MYNNSLNQEDLSQLLQLINATTFKGDAAERVAELKQKLLSILKELNNGKST